MAEGGCFGRKRAGFSGRGVPPPFLLRLGFAGQLRRLESGGFCRRFFAGQKFSAKKAAEKRRKRNGRTDRPRMRRGMTGTSGSGRVRPAVPGDRSLADAPFEKGRKPGGCG